jgi:hypothetical protein
MKTPLVYIRNEEKSSRIWREAQNRSGVFKMGWSRHCEEAADEAISMWQGGIASPQTARNDGHQPVLNAPRSFRRWLPEQKRGDASHCALAGFGVHSG